MHKVNQFTRLMREKASVLATCLPKNALLDPQDILAISNHHAFVGVGLKTNMEGAKHLMTHIPSVSNSNAMRVSVVVDAFERSESHPTLSSILRFPKRGMAITLDPHKAKQASSARIVHEYTQNGSEKGFFLNKSNVDLMHYIRKDLRYRILSAPSSEKMHAMQSFPKFQSTNSVFMVAPTAFEFNESAAQDNKYMVAERHQNIRSQVLREYSELYRVLRVDGDVDVHLFTHETQHNCPDACFPNNWFSTHPDWESVDGSSTLCLYPMKVPNRRTERRQELIDYIRNLKPYDQVADYTTYENQATCQAFEGTGVLVIDRVNKIAYVALSERADKTLAEKWASDMGYELITFPSRDENNHPIYHTNVMMCIGTHVAIICADAIPDTEARDKVMKNLARTHTVVNISSDQVRHLAGNVLEVEMGDGSPALAMSSQA
eukprot:TRINITY_DN8786_c0_g1::TRINITY_DN8786_c0_g1_i1::g.23842::m.23842 TRINITY_DN8786_c0_g1::TRINITY_DN8786_c0_g1_i1::g.23842  ORF type:complete len:434 (-),score=51.35,Amidinotransf/PF02274.12/6.6,Amidinotransf/PF02274.12/3.1e-51 TRINITY_DN8786_c0_g1_i1:77-1378(-)